MKVQKGFTLIELMVVIVIIGILSALAIPKMFGVSSKAKAAEAPGVVANWETLQSAYAQETGTTGTDAAVGFQNPMSNWFTYASMNGGAAMAQFSASVTAGMDFGECTSADAADVWSTEFDAATDVATRAIPAGGCGLTYTPNFN